MKRKDFVDIIDKAGFSQKKNKIHELAEKILKERSVSGSEDMYLGDIENYALGFRQNQSKVFAFGGGNKKIFAFQKKTFEEVEQLEGDLGKGGSPRKRNPVEEVALEAQYVEDVIMVARPTAIKFPKFTRPILQLACGLAHVLALSDDNVMLSWGCGQYGALGFGSREDVSAPRKLEIRKNDSIYQIVGVAAGKYHSLCITKKKKAYSWGTGTGGRLGHDDEEDRLVPTEVQGKLERD